MKNLEELKTKRSQLEKEAEQLQVKQAEHAFEINLEDRKMLKTIMDHLNKGYTWKTQNAAVLVTLYDKLKSQNNELLKSDNDEGDVIVSLRGHELNGLYQALLNVEGTGIESARKFIKMLTLVGETVTTAMSELAEMNSKIQEVHQELGKLDTEIDRLSSAEQVSEEDVELIANETGE
jgi:hypothetical protein